MYFGSDIEKLTYTDSCNPLAIINPPVYTVHIVPRGKDNLETLFPPQVVASGGLGCIVRVMTDRKTV